MHAVDQKTRRQLDNAAMFTRDTTVSFLGLGHQGGSRGRLVLPVGGQLAVGAVVPGQAVDARLDENEAELGVLVATVTLKVLAHGHGLLDKHVKVLGDLSGQACRTPQPRERTKGLGQRQEGEYNFTKSMPAFNMLTYWPWPRGINLPHQIHKCVLC